MANEALELVLFGEDQPVAYACAACGAVFSVRVEGAKELAAAHCNATCQCGAALGEKMALCAACVEKERAEREGRLFEVAGKIPIDDYPDEPVYWEGQAGSMGVGFFLNIDELLDYCEEEQLETPKYVWACAPRPLSVPTDAVLQAAVDEHNVGVDDLSATAVTELQTFLDSWCKQQNLHTWYPDYGRAVLLHEVPGAPIE